MKRILVATDGSAGADRAVDYAAQLAKTAGAELLIANVMGALPDKLFSAFTRAQHAWLTELLESQSAELLAKARDRAKSVGVRTIHLESRSGDVAQTVIEIAQDKGVDLIVAGKRGTDPATRLLLGSVSQKLVSLAPVPVTVLP